MDLIDEQLAAANARDLERFVATYAPGVVIEDRQGNGLMQGHAQLRERYGALLAASPELHCRIVTRIRLGSYTADAETITGRQGSAEPVRAVVIYRVEGDKIVHVRILR